MWVGIDDTDSVNGGCTTYLCSLICSKLEIKGHPLLIRLNPNIPYKTRGNGAVALNLGSGESIKDFVLDAVSAHGWMQDKKTNPGVVFLDEINADNKRPLCEFYLKAVSQLTTIEEAEMVAKNVNADVHKFKNGRGIIGALAALGCSLNDSTYELIAYRSPAARGPRRIDRNSVFDMNDKSYPLTYDNVDLETKQILITPRGPDPVFCGIRGETPAAVEDAWRMVRSLEDISMVRVFRTNQGTDDHLVRKSISDVRPYDCVSISGLVVNAPRTIEGGHVVFRVSDGSGSIWCAAYGPTGGFRRVVSGLSVGDAVECLGGVGRYPGTVNLEKIFVSGLAEKRVRVVPNCCGRKMTSAGKGKGIKCRKCGKVQREVKTRILEREIRRGWYEVPPRARRHLSKPLVREKQRFNTWCKILNDGKN